jgi:outer membrane protein OmpA-like peptidoglycan-associated protein
MMQKIQCNTPLVSAPLQNVRQNCWWFLLVIGLLGMSQKASAQSRRAYERAGDQAVEQKNYGTALQHYNTALGRKPTDVNLMWKYAESARQIYSFSLAEKMYRRLESVEGAKRPSPLLAFRLGEVVKNQGRYEEAIPIFEQFLSENPTSEFAERARAEISACRWAIQHAQDETAGVQVRNAGKAINSPYSDFAPFVVGDTLYFSSYRFDKRNDKALPKTKLTKVLFSPGNTRPREAANRGFPSIDSAHVAHTTYFGDGNFLIFTLCKNLNASDIRCDLWLTVRDIRKRWGKPVRLPEPVNLPGYTTTHPSVGYDTTAEQLNLWFASDRPGGQGGLDIWYIPLDTNWFCPCNVPVDGRKPLRLPFFEDPPVNIPAINTPGNDATPFFHESTRTLYLSTDSREGYGGYDIFRASMTDDTQFSVPENVGPALNSSYNDLYFILSPNSKSGYLSSNRPGAQYLDEANKSCCNDIFVVEYPEPPKETPPDKNVRTPQPAQPIERPMIPIEQLQPKLPEAPAPVLADFVGLPLYFDNDEPDKRTRRTRTQKSYAETAQAYLERQGEYLEQFSKGLNGTRRDTAEQQIDDFFENEVRRGYERLDQLCEILLSRLKAGEYVEVVIKGFTSPRAESDYNLALGKRRISSVRNQFDTYSDGIFRTYLNSGQLKVSETSFGETTVRTGISDDLRDERNSIYHPDAARERRVEIIEIRERR